MMRSPKPAFDVRAALTEELRAAIDELEASDGKPKSVHRVRVRVKRARALARVGRACAPGLSAVFNDSARQVMRVLAHAHDVTALAQAAHRRAAKVGGRAEVALEHVADALETLCLSMPPLDVPAVQTGLRDLLALAQVWPEASPRQIQRGAQRIARRARRAFRRGRGAEEAARRHEWRKREKDRFYAALLLDEAWPAARRRKRGAELGAVLGEERDALLLIERIEASPELAGDAKSAERALKALYRRRNRLGRRADALGALVHDGGA